MTTTVQSPAAKAPARIPMTSTRKTALVAGVFYLITFCSIPTLALYGPVKNHRDWVLGTGGHTGVLVGGIQLGSPILAGLPVAAWELSLGVWLTVKGFRPTAITAGIDAAA